MDIDSAYLEALFYLHEDLPRQGPGSDTTTLEVLRSIPDLPSAPHVLDLGCGSGASSLVLARELQTQIIAVDIHRAYLDQLERAAAEEGLGERILIRQADMGQLDYAFASFDLIWSEGAAFLLGFANALRTWRPLLKPGGFLAVSECTWLSENPPADIATYWHDAYPAMATAAANSTIAVAAGYDVVDTKVLPATAWWENYYGPLRQRMTALKTEARRNPALAQVIADTEQEMEILEKADSSFGYVFYVLRNRT